MKFALAILASSAAAVAVESNDQFGFECYGDWIYEECSDLYYQSDYCSDDCGWWYSSGFDADWSDDYWVTCDEFASWEFCQFDYYYYEQNACGNEWYYSDYDEAWWRYPCEEEYETECGWMYYDDEFDYDYYLDCDVYYGY